MKIVQCSSLASVCHPRIPVASLLSTINVQITIAYQELRQCIPSKRPEEEDLMRNVASTLHDSWASRRRLMRDNVFQGVRNGKK